MVDYSDGYHTFTELYEHRVALWIALCRQIKANDRGYYHVFRTKLHQDGTGFPGWFLLCIEAIETEEQMSYHLPDSEWEKCGFATTYEQAPRYDGHTTQDVLKRLEGL